MNTSKDLTRYDRQIVLQGFGKEGQQRLSDASVLVVGAGGLGCPALQYLAAAGVGRIGIADDDVVSLSNLHRQILFTMADLGTPKAETAASKLRQLNSDIEIQYYQTRLDVSNALDIISNFDIVLDGTDNFASRYMINDACVLLKKPLIFGAIAQYEGQVSVFNVPDSKNMMSNYRDLFPDPPGDNEIPNCAEAGVLGILPGIIGTMQAAEAIKLITGIGSVLAGRLLTFNVLTNQLYEVSFSPSKESQALLPADKQSFLNMHYKEVCSINDSSIVEIDATQFKTLRLQPSTLVIDVREENEVPRLTGFEHAVIPMSKFYNELGTIKAANVILLCQHGIRSMYAAELLHEENQEIKKLYSLKGGISRWISELNS
ncbi:MAG: molybdopterin-synthase adenylyltransferase MoeB [Pedobacter sp.]|nr:MAG: molybdopterin-synthase adenylyltransferase MoeB [Pedobacter sp.]